MMEIFLCSFVHIILKSEYLTPTVNLLTKCGNCKHDRFSTLKKNANNGDLFVFFWSNHFTIVLKVFIIYQLWHLIF